MPRIMREVMYVGDMETMDIGGTQRDHDTYNRLAAQLNQVLPPGDLQDSILERQFEKGLRGDTPAQLINSLRREIENIDNLGHERDDRTDGRSGRGVLPRGYEGDMDDMSDGELLKGIDIA